MILYIAIIAVQVALIIDVIRHGANRIWIMALMFLPLASTIAYLIVEVLPRMKHNRHVRNAQAQIIEKLDPERELRAARDALDLAGTSSFTGQLCCAGGWNARASRARGYNCIIGVRPSSSG